MLLGCISCFQFLIRYWNRIGFPYETLYIYIYIIIYIHICSNVVWLEKNLEWLYICVYIYVYMYTCIYLYILLENMAMTGKKDPPNKKVFHHPGFLGWSPETCPEAQDGLFRCGLPKRQPRASGLLLRFFFGFFSKGRFFSIWDIFGILFCVFWRVQIPPHVQCFKVCLLPGFKGFGCFFCGGSGWCFFFLKVYIEVPKTCSMSQYL